MDNKPLFTITKQKLSPKVVKKYYSDLVTGQSPVNKIAFFKNTINNLHSFITTLEDPQTFKGIYHTREMLLQDISQGKMRLKVVKELLKQTL